MVVLGYKEHSLLQALRYAVGDGVSIYDVSTCRLILDYFPRHGSLAISFDSLPPPSTTAGFRSTFDRLPYGCLLFMLYRLDLTD